MICRWIRYRIRSFQKKYLGNSTEANEKLLCHCLFIYILHAYQKDDRKHKTKEISAVPTKKYNVK
jgi:hypothetical protein